MHLKVKRLGSLGVEQVWQLGVCGDNTFLFLLFFSFSHEPPNDFACGPYNEIKLSSSEDQEWLG